MARSCFPNIHSLVGCQILANGPLRDKESKPLLGQCLKTLLGSMGYTTKAAGGSCNRQSQQTSAIPRPTAPLFPSWRVLSNIGYWAIARQGGANHCCGSV